MLTIHDLEPSEMPDFEIHLPAIRGVQAGRPFYIALCPARFIPRLIPLESPGALEASSFGRVADRSRSQDIARYLAGNPESYVLPAITCLVNGNVDFDEPAEKGRPSGLGTMRVPLTSRILILDGVNRRAGVEMALKMRPELGDEAIPILFYVDSRPNRVEQMISDIQRNGSRSARSQGILCDRRDETARITRELLERVDVFKDMTETVRSTISNRSFKLFTLSGIYHATGILLTGKQEEPYADRLALAVDFWSEVSRVIPDWQRAKAREISPADLRKTYVHSHAIALASLARAGKSLIKTRTRSWKRRLLPLRTLDWARSNTSLWEGRAMIAGRISKTNVSVVLAGNVIKQKLDLPLDADERSIEETWLAARS
ncbi:MAG: DNA sulfur modification protein DndB [Isosphaeraceae bacterium]|jgi:DNA sulfur modification protein DndB